MVAFRAVRPADALHFIDFGTIVLLFSMMLLVAYLHLDGFFDWVTEWIAARIQPTAFIARDYFSERRVFRIFRE